MRFHTKKLTIVITMKQLIIASTIVVVCIVGAISFYLHRRIKFAKEQRLKYYKRAASRLRGEMRLDPTIMEDNNKFPRYKRAYKTLLNNYFDHDVIALDFNITDCYDNETIIEIRYIAEITEVTQVFYTSYNDDAGDIGHVFLAPDNMFYPSMRASGIANLCIRIRVDPNLSANDTPYNEWDDDRLYLVMPQMTFDSIKKKEGQFILLDDEGNVLDRFGLKQLSDKKEKTLLSDPNVIP